LCKRQRRDQSANQSNDCSFHSDASFWLVLPPQFVTHGSSGRSLCVNLFTRFIMRRVGSVDFTDLSGHHEFANMKRQ
jgi:hypothetical protein